jgi:hypothetical protein
VSLCAGPTAPALGATAPIVGIIAGHHGSHVRLDYRWVGTTREGPEGVTLAPLEPTHTVRLTRAGRFSVTVQACPGEQVGNVLVNYPCSHGEYEVWASFYGRRCTVLQIINMTAGVPHILEWFNTKYKHPEIAPDGEHIIVEGRWEPLVCHA